jgi:TPP-dependent pyruvate/acetoin dehydrogenase alpha subunit
MGTDEYSERHAAAVAKMFAARGVDIDGDDGEAVARAMYELYHEAKAAGMPLPVVPEAS